jgi:hypothetical protein
VRVYGHDRAVTSASPVPQAVAWDFPVTVQDVVMMGRIRKIGLFRWPRRKDWQFIRQSMRSVGVDGLADRQIAELSGGQQQKVFLAQAIAQEAELVLLDEPLGGLDLPSQEAIFEILEQLKGQGVACWSPPRSQPGGGTIRPGDAAQPPYDRYGDPRPGAHPVRSSAGLWRPSASGPGRVGACWC